MTRLLKSCVLIALSIGLLYSGVAWAFGCSRHRAHSHSALSPDHHHAQPLPPDDPSLPLTPTVHCPPLMLQMAPAESAKLFEFLRQLKSASLHIYSDLATVSPHLTDHLWLEALFKNRYTSFLSSGPPRYQFFAVLRI